jgi:hypothetical protein
VFLALIFVCSIKGQRDPFVVVLSRYAYTSGRSDYISGCISGLANRPSGFSVVARVSAHILRQIVDIDSSHHLRLSFTRRALSPASSRHQRAGSDNGETVSGVLGVQVSSTSPGASCLEAVLSPYSDRNGNMLRTAGLAPNLPQYYVPSVKPGAPPDSCPVLHKGGYSNLYVYAVSIT